MDGDTQRCDGKYPCTPCAKLNEGSDCVYEQSRMTERMREKLPTAVQPFLFSFKSEPSPSGSSPPWANNESSSPPTTDPALSDTGSSAPSPTGPDFSPTESRLPESDTPDEFEAPTPSEGSISETGLVPFHEGSPVPHQPTTTSTLSLPPSFQFSPIPRQLPMSLSFLGPEHFQVSDTTSSERDLS